MPGIDRPRVSSALIVATLLLGGVVTLAIGGRSEPTQEGAQRKRDWAGVARHGDRLLLVENRTSGGYFEVPLGAPAGRVIPIAPKWRPWKGTRKQSDLESIDVLADGRIVVLSEDRRTLVGKEGVLARYPKDLAERGNRGLEGLAVRPGEEGGSVVAVCHEGGFQVSRRSAGEPPRPRVLIHTIEADGKAGEVGGTPVELEVERPDDGERFRAPDLVWHRISSPVGSSGPWGFIVLLGSTDRADRSFSHSRLARFTIDGKRVGKPLDLRRCKDIPPALRAAQTNWEGLGWWEPGRSLVLCFDREPRSQAPVAVVIDLPEAWR